MLHDAGGAAGLDPETEGALWGEAMITAATMSRDLSAAVDAALSGG